MKHAKKLLGVAIGCAIAMPTLANAGTSSPQVTAQAGGPAAVSARITRKINESDLAMMRGHVRPFLNKATDRGAVDDDSQVGPIMLLFSRTPQQQADLDAFVDSLHNRNSANFHHWMTPAQFGARFEPADSDVATVKSWLESHGFKVIDVAPSKTHLSFVGTAGQIREAFHTEIHNMRINGEDHVAAVSDPQIPAALAPVVAGLNKLDNFAPRPLFHGAGAFRTNLRTHESTPAKAKNGAPYAPDLTFSSNNENYYEVGPQDFYTIYNEKPLISSGITGAGQTIAVIEEVQVAAADVTAFRSLFGLPAYPSTPNSTQGGVNYLYGSSSGLNGYASCLAPVSQSSGKTSGEESEADIDVQWAGTAAPNAIIDLVACGGTNGGDGTALGSLGIDYSAQYIANYLSGTVVAASMSYGECEADMTSANSAYYNGQWEQFAAEGITPIVSSGDGGGEQCYQNDADATTTVPSVNGMGSSAYNISAGGTDLVDEYETNNYSTSPASTWWSSTNGIGEGSALSYIPETTWGGYCSNILYSSYLQKAGSTIFGTTYTPEAICSNNLAKAEKLLAVIGGAGGISTVTSIPTWQNVYGIGQYVGGVSTATTYRNIPDVSLFASNGFWGHYLPYCESDVDACTLANYEATDLGAGGTSFVAPQLAGIMALVAQKTGNRQGQADYTFYNLAAQQYGTTTSVSSNIAACSGSGLAAGALPPSTCNFHDISDDVPSLQGGTITPGIYQPCVKGDVDCYDPNNTTYGVNVVPGTTASEGILGYTAGPGYDPTTGLGSLNIANVVTNWNKVGSGFATTSVLSASATTISAPSTNNTSGGSVTLTTTVTAAGRGGTVAPAGYVTFYLNSTSGTSLGQAPITVSSTGSGASIAFTGTAALTLSASSLQTGSNTIVAQFGGDGANDAPSTSNSVTVTVASATPVGSLDKAVDALTLKTNVPLNDQLYVNGWAVDPLDGGVSNVVVYVDGKSIGAATTGQSRPDVAAYFNNPAYSNAGWSLYYPASSLSTGTHTVYVIATGSTGIATTMGTLTFTVQAKAPIGNLERAVDTVTGNPTISQSTGSVWTSGWAATYEGNDLASSVQILVDGTPIANATLGISRPDVATYFSNPAWTNSGFQLSFRASALSIGTHQVTAIVTDSGGLTTTLGPLTISITQ